MNPDQVPVIAQAAKAALPVVTKLSRHYQQQPVTAIQAASMTQISKLTKAMTAAAGLIDDQDDVSGDSER